MAVIKSKILLPEKRKNILITFQRQEPGCQSRSTPAASNDINFRWNFQDDGGISDVFLLSWTERIIRTISKKNLGLRGYSTRRNIHQRHPSWIYMTAVGNLLWLDICRTFCRKTFVVNSLRKSELGWVRFSDITLRARMKASGCRRLTFVLWNRSGIRVAWSRQGFLWAAQSRTAIYLFGFWNGSDTPFDLFDLQRK